MKSSPKYHKDSVLVSYPVGPLCDYARELAFSRSSSYKKDGRLFQSFCFVCSEIHWHLKEKIHFRYTTSRCFNCQSKNCDDKLNRRKCSKPAKIA